MSYIGRDPAYGSFEKQSLTADGSTTTFTLNFTIGSTASIMVSVAGVLQEPETAYNIASGGTQIVFTAAPESGDTVFIIFLGIAYDVVLNSVGNNSIEVMLGYNFGLKINKSDSRHKNPRFL